MKVVIGFACCSLGMVNRCGRTRVNSVTGAGSCLGNRVETTPAGIAAPEAAERHPAAAEQAEAQDSYVGILRAGGEVAAIGESKAMQHGGDELFVALVDATVDRFPHRWASAAA